ncbi:hypothetical protein TNCV_3594341 [Trichonephila clavipes]|nr:hypothetical protein TNCV_3594341 [Trichonephila clavipes]
MDYRVCTSRGDDLPHLVSYHCGIRQQVPPIRSCLSDDHLESSFTTPRPLNGLQHLQKIKSTPHPGKVGPPLLYRVEVSRPGWSIHMVNILTLEIRRLEELYVALRYRPLK